MYRIKTTMDATGSRNLNPRTRCENYPFYKGCNRSNSLIQDNKQKLPVKKKQQNEITHSYTKGL